MENLINHRQLPSVDAWKAEQSAVIRAHIATNFYTPLTSGIGASRDNNVLALSVAETARVTGLSRASLYRLIASGELQSRKVGARTLVLNSEIDRFLNSLPIAARRGE